MSQYPQSPLMGQMMHQPLLISSIIEHADRQFGKNEIVSRRVEGDIHRYTYRDCHRRARQMSNALRALGVKMGERVATLAWNGYRHMELYYAVSGSGAVLHTINPRLFAEQIAYIANHAEDQYLFFDMNFLPLAEAFAAHCTTIKAYVMMCDRDRMPKESKIANLLCYEDLIDNNTDDYVWPLFDENSASSLCYTSGTTGHPKGALYSHRSTVLHSLGSCSPDGLNVSARDVVLPVVPMFHVNAWGLPYSVPMYSRSDCTASGEIRVESVRMYVMRPTVPSSLPRSTPSYRPCATCIVRLAPKPSRFTASCWSLLVE